MLKLATHADFGVQICKALGLEPETVSRIVLGCDCQDGGVAYVDVTWYVPADSVDGIADVVDRYYLIHAASI
jgi:hypothetical protein